MFIILTFTYWDTHKVSNILNGDDWPGNVNEFFLTLPSPPSPPPGDHDV